MEQNKENNIDQPVAQPVAKPVAQPLSFLDKIRKNVLGIECNKKIISDYFSRKSNAQNLDNFKIFVVQSKDKKRENYFEIFFDFGAVNLFAQRQKNLSQNQDDDLVDMNKESKAFFKQLFYEVYEASCVDLNEGIFEIKKTNEKVSLETLDSVKK